MQGTTSTGELLGVNNSLLFLANSIAGLILSNGPYPTNQLNFSFACDKEPRLTRYSQPEGPTQTDSLFFCQELPSKGLINKFTGVLY